MLSWIYSVSGENPESWKGNVYCEAKGSYMVGATFFCLHEQYGGDIQIFQKKWKKLSVISFFSTHILHRGHLESAFVTVGQVKQGFQASASKLVNI